MNSLVQSLVLWVVFAAGWAGIAAANLQREPQRPPVRFSWWGAAVWMVVAIPSIVQFAAPLLLGLWMRDGRIVADGEWWRLLTGNLVQDGGAVGAISNLATLAVTVLIVARAIPGPLMVVLFAVTGAGSMVLQLGHPGAGNSMATLALLAATAAIVTLRSRPPVVSVVATILVAAIGATLTLAGDEHGPAILLGLVAGVLCRWILPESWCSAAPRPVKILTVA